jgi:hypothetical protein
VSSRHIQVARVVHKRIHLCSSLVIPSMLQVSPKKPIAGLKIRLQCKESQALEPDEFCRRNL